MSNPSEQEHVKLPLPPPMVFVIPLVAGLIANAIFPMPFIPTEWAWIAGAISGVLGLLLAGWAIRTLFRAGDSPDPDRPVRALVTKGPFAFTRNPIYLGFAFLYGGVALFFDSPVTLILLPVVLYVHTRVIIQREEAYLASRFEADYLSYKGRVRRWL